jgi:hypothetical protein
MLRNILKSAFVRLRAPLAPRGRPVASPHAAALYLELMKKCLTNQIHDDDLDLLAGVNMVDPGSGRIVSVQGAAPDPTRKYLGDIWPSRAHTMIGIPRLNNLQFCIEDVLARGVPGDLIETGVWRGGATIFMRAVLKVHGVHDRTVWVADSFAGLPEANAETHPEDSVNRLHLVDALAVSLEEVQRNFERYNLLDGQVRFLKGWFCDTLPTAPINRLAVLRLDGDHYESTMDALNSLYPKLSPGGYVIVDDIGAAKGAENAIADFRRAHGIVDEFKHIEAFGGYWRRGN